jgi:hypothetical protein
MDAKMKKQLEAVITAVVEEDADSAKKAFHSYLRAKTQSILSEKADDKDEDDKDEDDKDEDDKDDKKSDKKDDKDEDKDDKKAPPFMKKKKGEEDESCDK